MKASKSLLYSFAQKARKQLRRCDFCLEKLRRI
nr:MAG TPA: hypothetical protein [Caudoviricetes sp.]